MSLVEIQLLPRRRTLVVEAGAPLNEVLFPEGVEFPCGGRGRCKGCRIRVLEGHLEAAEADRAVLSPAELAQGWRLACRARAEESLTLELAQWEPTILSDSGGFAFTPRTGLGVAVDLGTTTLVAQLLDMQTGNVLAVRTALNPQARHGADIMSRIEFALTGGQMILQRLIREEIGGMVKAMLTDVAVPSPALADVVLVGNTVMHHLFSGIPVDPLSHFPFVPAQDGLWVSNGADLGLDGTTRVHFLPCLGGFVGSDILAGILATELHKSEALLALIDLGTNGEIVVGNRDRLLCASTAAGPAFEGARISAGMRAATGAISEVAVLNGQLDYRVLGNGAPRGICGSGLVDAIAVGLELGWISASGRTANGASMAVAPGVAIAQRDIRELQLAKAAIAAGLHILLQRWGASVQDVTRVYLAGAFGNYIRLASARRIGLFPFAPERVEPAGNTALRGAKMALIDLADDPAGYGGLRSRVEHISLSDDEQFQDIFVDEMPFPS